MNAILPTDTLWARASVNGAVVARMDALTGISSWGQLMTGLTAGRRGLTGLVTIEVRNASQGWTTRRAVLFTASTAAA